MSGNKYDDAIRFIDCLFRLNSLEQHYDYQIRCGTEHSDYFLVVWINSDKHFMYLNDWNSIEDMESLLCQLENKERIQKEADKKAINIALAKLSEEEKQLLGLNK
jgi:hypothetical protein